MRKPLYLALEQRLQQIVYIDGVPTFEPDAEKRKDKKTVLRHFDLWNQHIIQLTRQRPFTVPAVLVEFDTFRWSYCGQRVREADIIIRLHIITATVATAETGNRYRNQALERFEIIDGITQALLGFSYDDGTRQAGLFRAYESTTDHNHEQVCEDIESWITHCRDAMGVPPVQPVTQPLRHSIAAPK